MREIQFLCLAVSRRDGGYCAAGVDLDSGNWIRPVNSTSHGALGILDVFVLDESSGKSRIMKPLDIVQLTLGESARTRGQPENWVLASPSNARIISTVTNNRAHLGSLWRLVEPTESLDTLFGTENNKVHHGTIEKEAISHSLLLIRPKGLCWVRTTNSRNEPRIEGRFNFGKRDLFYSLPLTDIEWEPALLKQTMDAQVVHEQDSPGMNASSEILLTVSLGELFAATGYHYKLIAGVLLLPRR